MAFYAEVGKIRMKTPALSHTPTPIERQELARRCLLGLDPNACSVLDGKSVSMGVSGDLSSTGKCIAKAYTNIPALVLTKQPHSFNQLLTDCTAQSNCQAAFDETRGDCPTLFQKPFPVVELPAYTPELSPGVWAIPVIFLTGLFIWKRGQH